MVNPGFKSKKAEVLRAILDFTFGFENKRGEVLSHWISFHDNFEYSPQEFYAAIEKELQARRIPNLEVGREEFAEGGPLSDRRYYLRLFRERLALYACASPFGAGYIFSCRAVYVPALVRLWHIGAALLFLAAVNKLLLEPLGGWFAVIALVTLVFAVGATLRNAGNAVAPDLDAFLLKIPVVSTIYEDWFREDTYFREDSRIVYLQRLPAVIKELAEDITAAKGARMVEYYEQPPVFVGLHKPPRATSKLA